MPNDMLRSHVTGTAFHLTLGKTHIAALVHIEERLAADLTIRQWASQARASSSRLGNFAPGASGLIARGLVMHADPRGDMSDKPYSAYWQITTAGRLVLELLREAGIWQEYATNPAAAEVSA